MPKEVVYVQMITKVADFEDEGMWSGYIKKIFINIMVIEVNRSNMENSMYV